MSQTNVNVPGGSSTMFLRSVESIRPVTASERYYSGRAANRFFYHAASASGLVVNAYAVLDHRDDPHTPALEAVRYPLLDA